MWYMREMGAGMGAGTADESTGMNFKESMGVMEAILTGSMIIHMFTYILIMDNTVNPDDDIQDCS